MKKTFLILVLVRAGYETSVKPESDNTLVFRKKTETSAANCVIEKTVRLAEDTGNVSAYKDVNGKIGPNIICTNIEFIELSNHGEVLLDTVNGGEFVI